MTAVTSSDPLAGTPVERPADLAQAVQALRDTRGSVAFRGGGTKMSWGGRLRDPAVVLETAGMRRLLTHNPADMTASVQAGMPLADLQDVLAESGQWFALDPPTQPAGTTVGGLLASGDYGPRRLRYGAVRDLVIGLTLVLPDGTVARAGGHVIKNVAGYDLTKLAYGSLGSLGLIAEVVFRVHPRPEASATMVLPASAKAATAAALRLLASPLEPAALHWVGSDADRSDASGSDASGSDASGSDASGSDARLAVRFEGSAAGVDAQVAALPGLLAEIRAAADVPVGAEETLRGPEEDDLWRRLGQASLAEAGECTAFAGTLPTQLPEVVRAVRAAGDRSGAEAGLASDVALGLHVARFRGQPAQQAAAFDAWRRDVLAIGGTVLLRDRPPEVDDLVDAFGPPPSAVGLLRALKSRLDPHGRCAPGRFGSWF